MKGMIFIKEFIIDDIEDLVSDAIDTINEDEAEYVAIIAKYEEANAIIKEILQYDETSIDYISLFSEEFDGYDKEYLILIDNNWIISCEQMYDEKYEDYPYFEADKIYIMEDCNSDAIYGINEDIIEVVIYSDNIDYLEDDCDYIEDDDIEVSIWNDKYNSGVTISGFDNDNSYHSFTYISSDESDIEDLLRILGYRE